MKTEEEAKTLWCPFAFVLGTLRQPAQPGEPDYVVGAGGQNRGFQMGLPLENCRCIASDCMAWRWAGYITGGKLYPNAMKAVNNERVGWCGLAGRPDQ